MSKKKILVFSLKLLIFVFFFWFMSIDDNPIVKLEAKLGLSPAPIERFFKIKSLFSGMTEGTYQLLNRNIRGALEANVFTPLVLAYLICLLFFYRSMKINTKKKEIIFFLVFIILSILVNIFN